MPTSAGIRTHIQTQCRLKPAYECDGTESTVSSCLKPTVLPVGTGVTVRRAFEMDNVRSARGCVHVASCSGVSHRSFKHTLLPFSAGFEHEKFRDDVCLTANRFPGFLTVSSAVLSVWHTQGFVTTLSMAVKALRQSKASSKYKYSSVVTGHVFNDFSTHFFISVWRRCFAGCQRAEPVQWTASAQTSKLDGEIAMR